MAEKVNKSLVIRTMFDKGLTMNQIHKVTKIRYNMVYNVLERYRTHKSFKEPKKYLDKASEEDINKAAAEVLAEMDIEIKGDSLVRREK